MDGLTAVSAQGGEEEAAAVTALLALGTAAARAVEHLEAQEARGDRDAAARDYSRLGQLNDAVRAAGKLADALGRLAEQRAGQGLAVAAVAAAERAEGVKEGFALGLASRRGGLRSA
jgi:hypothetical protein